MRARSHRSRPAILRPANSAQPRYCSAQPRHCESLDVTPPSSKPRRPPLDRRRWPRSPGADRTLKQRRQPRLERPRRLPRLLAQPPPAPPPSLTPSANTTTPNAAPSPAATSTRARSSPNSRAPTSTATTNTAKCAPSATTTKPSASAGTRSCPIAASASPASASAATAPSTPSTTAPAKSTRSNATLRPPTPTPFPRQLSQTGLFSRVRGHQVAPGVLPYEINAPFWSDGAHKERFVALPPHARIRFDEKPDAAWQFDDGTVTVKSFSLDMEEGNPPPAVTSKPASS